jgi:hypothetical protein
MELLMEILLLGTLLAFITGGVYVIICHNTRAIKAFLWATALGLASLYLGENISETTEYHPIIDVDKSQNGQIFAQTSPEIIIPLSDILYIIPINDITNKLMVKYTLKTSRIGTTTNFGLVVKEFINYNENDASAN